MLASLYGLMPLAVIPTSVDDEPPPGDGTGPGGTPTATRRCGRCLRQFPGDPDADPVVIPEFWMCPACREALLGKLSSAGVSVSAATVARTR